MVTQQIFSLYYFSLRAINTIEEQIAGASHEFLKFVDGLSELRHAHAPALHNCPEAKCPISASESALILTKRAHF
jgi:hypothetical protein